MSIPPILCSARQRGNPLLRHLRNTPIAFYASELGDQGDFILSSTTCLLFLSIQYHKLFPAYLYSRMEAVMKLSPSNKFRFRGILLLIDHQECEPELLTIQVMAIHNSFTVILAFSEEEASRYLESFRILQHRTSEELEGKKTVDVATRIAEALGKVRGVNKTDTRTLLRSFHTLSSLFQAEQDELELCAGIGEKKVARLHRAFHEPFFSSSLSHSTTTTTSTRKRHKEDNDVNDNDDNKQSV